ncbi:unnamed protein product, partial [Tetraodon nigroviridis]
NFSTFLLDRSTGVLFMGARDAILAVDTNRRNQPPKKISWEVPEKKRQSCVTKGKTEVDCKNYIRLLQFLPDGRVYVCGTYAFDPQCAFLELSTFTLEKAPDGGVKMESGKGKCPFEPSQHYTAVMADGTLYTAATSNFLGTLFDISRATGPDQERIRTEQSINWLNDPEFVSSAFVQQSAENNPTGEDDKIYFFFTEVAKEYDLYTKVKVPRVARVCKSDLGGLKTLQRRWTTFLKAQLVCEDKPSGQRYNVLTDVFTVQPAPGDPSTRFYGLFTSQWEGEEVSAVCVFSLSDINKVLNGPFKELKKSENWINADLVPTPRPGQCLNNDLKAKGIETSLKLPDKVLTFVRDHPLMENSVSAAPLLVRKGITYTKLAVAPSGRRGALLHLGTDRGELHRVAVVDQNTTLLQEIPLFGSQEPVNNIVLHQGRALVGSPLSLAQVPAEGCSLFPSCEVCARARGLGCVWSAAEEACIETTAEPLQPFHQRDARLFGPARPVAVRPAVPQALQLGAPSRQAHQAAPLRPEGGGFPRESRKIRLHVPGGRPGRARPHPLPQSRISSDSGGPHLRRNGGAGREPPGRGGLHLPVFVWCGAGDVPPALPDLPGQPPVSGPPPARQLGVLGEGPGPAGLLGHAAVAQQRHAAVRGLHAHRETQRDGHRHHVFHAAQ